MVKKISACVFVLLAALDSPGTFADESHDLQDVWLPASEVLQSSANRSDKPYTLLDYDDYNKAVSKAQSDAKTLISQIQFIHSANPEQYLTDILVMAGAYLRDVPYGGGEGEGNWCGKFLSRTGCKHIQQDPVYRTDTLNCTTFVQFVLGLINAKNLKDFTNNIVKIEYGAEANAGHAPAQIFAYSNRNNFADGDFNPVNQKHGLLTDVTGNGIFSQYVQTISADITRANWFAFQAKPSVIVSNVRVFTDKTGEAMSKKLSNSYGSFYKPENVVINYIPKYALVEESIDTGWQIHYSPNEQLINQIPTPAVLEVIRDDSKWFINGINIVDLIGSGTSVSHMAFLYRQHFYRGDTIYKKTYCYLNAQQQKQCTVTPIICKQKYGCTKTMMLAATSAYPNGYIWAINKKNRQI